MPNLHDLKPLQRQALPAMLAAASRSLVRCRGGYRPEGAATDAPVFTVRTINTLQADGLVEFDQRLFPERVTLNATGVRLATQLTRARTDAKARAQ